MKTSDKGQAFIKRFESFRNSMYLDQGGKPTIGYGHLIHLDDPLKLMNRIITLDEADEIFEKDIYFKGELCVNHYMKLPLKQYEYDALVSLTFNIGCGKFYSSTLLKTIYNPIYTNYDVAQEFLRWNKVRIDGKLVESAGLTRRRKAEKEMFLGHEVSTS